MFNINILSRNLIPVLIITLLCGCSNKSAEWERFEIVSEIKSNSESPFFIDFSKYPAKRESLPIGIFDSGTGGLSVLNSILIADEFDNTSHEEIPDGIPDFKAEEFIYLADEANMPYGKYESEGKSDLLKEHVIKDVGFLLGNKYYNSPDEKNPILGKEAVKLIVIACNTATAYGLRLVNSAMEEWGTEIKTLGIIDAGAESAVAGLNPDESNPIVAVLATEGTCSSNGYINSISKLKEEYKNPDEIEMVQQAGIGLAGAIDGDINYLDPEAVKPRDKSFYRGPAINNPNYPIDLRYELEYNFNRGHELLIDKAADGKITEIQLNSVENYIKYCVTHLVIKSLNNGSGGVINSVILGCTHYPYYDSLILKHFEYLNSLNKEYDDLISSDIVLIDPARELAKKVYKFLVENNLKGSGTNQDSKFYISVPNPLLNSNEIDQDGEFPFNYKYGRMVNSSLEFVKRVPFSAKWIKKGVMKRIQVDIPYTYELIINN